jgi:hypothetical protein
MTEGRTGRYFRRLIAKTRSTQIAKATTKAASRYPLRRGNLVLQRNLSNKPPPVVEGDPEGRKDH